jgi:rhodanese-related sulfurtransferase
LSPKTAVASPASEHPGVIYIGLLGAKKAFDEKNAFFIDARKAEEYAAGHIPGAIHFYADDFDRLAARVLPQLSPEKPYILYCADSECDLSEELAQKLDRQGFKRLRVFMGGWPEWAKAGYPAREGPNP